MFRYIIYIGILLSLVGGYLFVRKWNDRRVEKNTDTEIVRENEEYLGTWPLSRIAGL